MGIIIISLCCNCCSIYYSQIMGRKISILLLPPIQQIIIFIIFNDSQFPSILCLPINPSFTPIFCSFLILIICFEILIFSLLTSHFTYIPKMTSHLPLIFETIPNFSIKWHDRYLFYIIFFNIS
eukprot:UN00579